MHEEIAKHLRCPERIFLLSVTGCMFFCVCERKGLSNLKSDEQ